MKISYTSSYQFNPLYFPVEIYREIFRRIPDLASDSIETSNSPHESESVKKHMSTKSLIDTVSIVCQSWYKAIKEIQNDKISLNENAFGYQFLKNLNIRIDPRITFFEARKKIKETVVCVAIDYSFSMGSLFAIQPSLLNKCVAKALEYVKCIIHEIPKGNLYLMQFGKNRVWKIVKSVKQAEEFFARQRVMNDTTNIPNVYSATRTIYSSEMEQKWNQFAKTWNDRLPKKNKMEVNIFSDFVVDDVGQLNEFKKRKVDFRYYLAGSAPAAAEFKKNTLEITNPMNVVSNEERGSCPIYAYGQSTLAFTTIDAEEIKRPLQY